MTAATKVRIAAWLFAASAVAALYVELSAGLLPSMAGGLAIVVVALLWLARRWESR